MAKDVHPITTKIVNNQKTTVTVTENAPTIVMNGRVVPDPAYTNPGVKC